MRNQSWKLRLSLIIFVILTWSCIYAQFAGGNGTQADPFQISTASQLNSVRTDLSAFYIQSADINLDTAPWNQGSGFVPIGNNSTPFIGSYNGDGYIITGLTINRAGSDYQGLFGKTIGAEIKNLKLENAAVLGRNYTGALVGSAVSSSLHELSVNGNVTGTRITGGLIGSLEGGSTIINSFSLCSVSGQQNTGGLVGYLKNGSLMQSCYSCGEINSSTAVGGLVGSNAAGISNSYSTAMVNGTSDVGGLVGFNDVNATINGCFSTGLVTGTSSQGGLVGRQIQSIITQSYWNTQTSGQSNSAGGEGRATYQMVYPYATDTYLSWDFTGVWTGDFTHTINEGYPYLHWQTPQQSFLPQNFTAGINEAELMLNWQTPVIGAPQEYQLWRLQPGEETDEASWTPMSTVISSNTYTDTDWSTLPEGTYKWSIRAMYPDGIVSQTVFSNELEKIIPVASISVTPDSIHYTITVRDSLQIGMLISNTGNAGLNWNSQIVNNRQLNLSLNPTGGFIAPHTSVVCYLIVHPDVSSAGSYDYRINISSNDPVHPLLEIPVSLEINPVLPSVTTAVVSGITDSTATSGGSVISDGGSSLTAYGIVWNTTGNPTVLDNEGITSNSDNMGAFVSEMTGLYPLITYSVRAYATNSRGTAYGAEFEFVTAATVYYPPRYLTASISEQVIALSWQTPLSGYPRAYHLWRLQPGQETEEASWTPVGYPIKDTAATDPQWDSLSDGIYKWAVKALYTGEHFSPATFSNELTKLNVPEIAVSPLSIDYSMTTNDSLQFGVTISNTGNAALSWSSELVNSRQSSNRIWQMNISMNPTGGVIGPDSSMVCSLTVNQSNASPGAYYFTLYINSNDPVQPSVEIPITITLTSPIAYIPDMNFRMAINEYLGEALDYLPTIADLNGITGTLEANQRNILSIEGAQYLVNADTLFLSMNQITDITPLAGLTSLRGLYLSVNQVSDISALAELTNLVTLALGMTQTIDISPLAGLYSLNHLNLDNCQINDISPLAGLTQLIELNLNNNQVDDITSLVGLVNLESLNLQGCSINEVSPIAAMTNLQILWLDSNEISDVTPISGLPNLVELYLGGNPLSRESVRLTQSWSLPYATDAYSALSACYPNPRRNATGIFANSSLQWNGNYAGETFSYEVWLGNSPTQLTLVGTVEAGADTLHAFTPLLTPYTSYWWRVRAIMPETSIWSGLWSFTTGQMEQFLPPANLQAIASTDFVNISWDAPGATYTLFNDDFESYPDFAFEFAPWTIVDADQSPTYSMTNTNYPGETNPMGFIVFNPNTTSPVMTSAATHSGNKMVATVADTALLNDDWMISPPILITDFNKELSFWAKSYTATYGLERFKVAISLGGTDPSDFTVISGAGYLEAPVEWTKYVFSLAPYTQETIRFAIHCVSADAFIFFVDDVSVGNSSGHSVVTLPAAPLSYSPGSIAKDTKNLSNVSYSSFNGPASGIQPSQINRRNKSAEPAASRVLTGYKVWRLPLGQEANENSWNLLTSIATYTHTVMDTDWGTTAEGTYKWAVKAVYNGSTLSPAVFSNYIMKGEQIGNPVNLTANLTDSTTVALRWNLNYPNWLQWDTGFHNSSFGSYAARAWEAAAKFDSNDLSEEVGRYITKVKFCPDESTSIYRVRIWSGDDGSLAPSYLLVDQELGTNLNYGSWNTIDLDTPVPIQPGTAYWIGYSIDQINADTFPAGVDRGPRVPGKGGLVNWGTGWSEITDINSSCDYNWNIQAYVEPSFRAPSVNTLLNRPLVYNQAPYSIGEQVSGGRNSQIQTTRSLQRFDVYRNNALIGTTIYPNYADSGLADGQYSYFVQAIYQSNVSAPSNTASLVIQNHVVPRNLVVVEIGNGIWVTYGPGAQMAGNDLITNGHQVAVIQNLNSGAFANQYSDARNTYYDITGYPTAQFDGLNTQAGGSQSSSMYPAYAPKVEARIAVPSSYTVSATGVVSDNAISIDATVQKAVFDLNENVVLHCVFTESGVLHNWYGQSQLDHINRLMAPDANGTPISLGIGEQITIPLTATWDSNWNKANSEVVLFLQNTVTKEILQGIKYPLADFIPVPHDPPVNLTATLIAENPVLTWNPPLAGNPIEYKLWRLQPGMETDETGWTVLSSSYIDTTYTDPLWYTLADGNYKWAVKAVYSDETLSVATFSNELTKINTFPVITVTPTSMEHSMALYDLYQTEVVISNTGTADLNWSSEFVDNRSSQINRSNGLLSRQNSEQNRDNSFNMYPSFGTLAADSSVVCQIEIGLNGSTPGLYSYNLNINSDDPALPILSIPIDIELFENFDTPQNLVATADNAVVYLDWDDVFSASIQHYSVYRDSVEIGTIVGSSYEDHSVVNGTTYEYWIVANYLYGVSTPSNIVTAIPVAPNPDGLVRHYSFDGNANDVSGYGQNAVVYGATLTTDRLGNPDSAYSFDGIGNYLKAGTWSLPTAERTVAMWFKASGLTTRPTLLGYGGGSGGTSWVEVINHGGSPTIDMTCHYWVNTLEYYYETPPVGQWYHLAVTTNTDGTKMYINGIEVASNSSFVNNTNITDRDLIIGCAVSAAGYGPYTDSNVGYFNGSMDDVRIYNRALSDTEILNIINADEFASGSGTEADPYLVATAEHLNNVRNHLDAHFLQIADINLGMSPWNDDEGWVPIGSYVLPFAGNYDGQNHRIDGLRIERLADYQGLFGYTTAASLQNIRIYSVNVSGSQYVGGLVGCSNSNSSISSCHITGIVAGGFKVGGLIGYNNSNSSISSCISEVNVTGSSNYTGGLVGESDDNSSINSCFSTGDVVGTNYVGGLTGMIGFTSAISNSYSTSSVTGTMAVGGFIGRSFTSTIINSFSLGSVSGTENVGGLLGSNLSSTVTDSYWNTQTTGQLTSAGGSARTTLDMTYPHSDSTYVGWNFTDTWAIDFSGLVNNGYPYLISPTTPAQVYPPSFAPVGGTYQTSQNVVLSTPAIGATIHYTTDGSEPDETSAIYTSEINIPLNTNMTIKAVSYMSDMTHSVTTQQTYIVTGQIVIIDPVFSPAPGLYTSAQTIAINTPIPSDATVRYTIDGSDPTETNGTIYVLPFQIETTTTVKAIAYKTDWASSTITSAIYQLTDPPRNLVATLVSRYPLLTWDTPIGGSPQAYQLWRLQPGNEALPLNWTLVSASIPDTSTTFTDPQWKYAAYGTYKWALKAIYTGGNFSTAVLSNELTKIAPIITDDNFRFAINQHLGQATDYQPTIADLNGMTGNLEATNRFITNLEGAQYLTGIQELDLTNNQISNIATLDSLYNLQRLSLGHNQLSDISALSGLSSLMTINLWENQIVNISPLAGLTNVTQIMVYNNLISDITALGGMTGLQYLSIGLNPITDISPLAGRTALDAIYAYNCQIKDISPLAGLTNLVALDLQYNPVNELSALSGLVNLQRLWLTDTRVSDIAPLAGLTSLTNLYLDGNPLSKESMLLSQSWSLPYVASTFTPIAPCYPNPIRNASDIPVNSSLQWFGNFNHQTAAFDVWMGHSPTELTQVGSGINLADSLYSFTPTLAYNSSYWWRIRAVAAADTVWSGLWSFKTITSEFAGGSGTVSDPYLVANPIHLNNVRNHLDAYYRQTADIDLGTSPWSLNEGWVPIGTVDVEFTGSYNGDYYSVSNLTINRSAAESQGLFGYTNGAIIDKLKLQNVAISAGSAVGGLAGTINYSSVITNCHVTGKVSGMSMVGGLIGASYASSLAQCSAADSVISQYNSGGLVGYNSGSTISQCFASGNIACMSSFAGGLVGSNTTTSTIINSYATGSVNGNDFKGGLVGQISMDSAITNCYAIGAIIGAPYNTGGLIGSNYSFTNVTNSYWNTDTAGLYSSAGGFARTTIDMTYPHTDSTYVSWDFETVWSADYTNLNNNGYPYLAWQQVQVLEAPVNLTAGYMNGHVMLSWDAVPGATSYDVYSSDYFEGVFIFIGNVSINSFVDPSTLLTNYYKVTAKINQLESSPSNTVTLLEPPTNLTANLYGNDVVLTWSMSSGAMSYKVYRSESGEGTFAYLGMVTDTSFVDMGFPLTQAYYRVTAVYTLGESSPSLMSFVAQPAPVQLILSIDPANSDAVLSWDRTRDAVSYQVYYTDNPSAAFPAEWTGPITIESNSYIEHLAAKRFYKVLANVQRNNLNRATPTVGTGR